MVLGGVFLAVCAVLVLTGNSAWIAFLPVGITFFAIGAAGRPGEPAEADSPPPSEEPDGVASDAPGR